MSGNGWARRPPTKTGPSPYDAAWRKLRLQVLARDGWRCQLCSADLKNGPKGFAHVDHILPVAERPDLRLDPNNLRALCRRCNLRLGAKLGRARQHRRRSGRAWRPERPW